MLIVLLAFAGGALTILSPCILPVLPFVFARAEKPFLRSGLPMLPGMAATFALVATLAAVGGGWALEANQYVWPSGRQRSPRGLRPDAVAAKPVGASNASVGRLRQAVRRGAGTDPPLTSQLSEAAGRLISPFQVRKPMARRRVA